MAVTVKGIVLWRRELENRPGALAEVLAPLWAAGADLQVAMGYRIPGNESRAVVELAPVKGRKQEGAARTAGLAPSGIPTLLVTGDDRPGAGRAMAEALGEAGISMAFLVAQVVGRKYTMIVGFDNEADAKAATPVIKRSAAVRRPPARRR